MKFCSCYSNIETEKNYEKSNPIKIIPQTFLLRFKKFRLNFVSRPVFASNHTFTVIPTALRDEGLGVFAS